MKRISIPILAVLLLLAGGCRPLYMPFVPEMHHPEPRPRVAAQLEAEWGRPVLRVRVLEVPQEGWLAVQWFAPDNREAASESVWVSRDSPGTTFTLALPDDVQAHAGEWRALLSIHSAVLRQLSVVIEGN